jgi:hypothetical protein
MIFMKMAEENKNPTSLLGKMGFIIFLWNSFIKGLPTRPFDFFKSLPVH